MPHLFQLKRDCGAFGRKFGAFWKKLSGSTGDWFLEPCRTKWSVVNGLWNIFLMMGKNIFQVLRWGVLTFANHSFGIFCQANPMAMNAEERRGQERANRTYTKSSSSLWINFGNLEIISCFCVFHCSIFRRSFLPFLFHIFKKIFKNVLDDRFFLSDWVLPEGTSKEGRGKYSLLTPPFQTLPFPTHPLHRPPGGKDGSQAAAADAFSSSLLLPMRRRSMRPCRVGERGKREKEKGEHWHSSPEFWRAR